MRTDRVPVFDVDPELAELVPSDELDDARSAAVVSLHELSTGPWQSGRRPLPAAGSRRWLPGPAGMSVAGGLGAGRADGGDFLAHGDVLHPSTEPAMTSVPVSDACVLEPTRLALLDAAFLASVQPWPQVTASLLRRQERRSNWLAHVLAINHLPRVETRILMLFWLFADRWDTAHEAASASRSRSPTSTSPG